MGLRSLIDNNRTPIAIGATAVILSFLGWSISNNFRSPAVAGPGHVFFYNVSTGQLVAMPGDTMPPADAPDGAGQLVRAYVYACGECTANNRKALKLESISDEAKKALDAAGEDPARRANAMIAAVQGGKRIAAPPDAAGKTIAWVAMNGREAGAINKRIADYCGGDQKLIACHP